MKKFFMLSAIVAATAVLTIGVNARAESGAEKSGLDSRLHGNDKTTKAVPAKKGATVSPAKEADPKVKRWTWKREIKGVQLGNLAAPWNGSTVFFTITAPSSMKTDKQEGDVIAAVGENSAIVGEMGGDILVKSLYSEGAGDQLLAETKDGKFFFWPDWKKRSGEKKAIDYPVGAVPSQTLKTAIFVDKGKKEATIYGQDGKKLRSYPLKSIPDSVPAVSSPFFKDEEFVLIISAEGDVTYYNREKKLWSLSLGAPAKAVASSYMKDERLAFGTKDGIILVDGKDGTLKGKVSLKNDKLQLDCAQDGSFCAAIGGGRLISFQWGDSKEAWSHNLDAKPRRSFLKLQALAKGNQVIAGLEEKDGPEIEAFDEKGEIIWRAPLGAVVLDYRVSWGGDAIAALYKDFVNFYNFKPQDPKTMAPLNFSNTPKKPGEKHKHKKNDSKSEAKPETEQGK
jgi:hypothetical protein